VYRKQLLLRVWAGRAQSRREPFLDNRTYPMRRSALCLAAVLLLAPATTQAQVSLLFGAGLTNPMSDLNDVSDVGWHAMGGAKLSIAAFPVGLRADGAYQSFGEQGMNPQLRILSGSLSVVVTFPGIGLSPYVLGGLGVYRTSVDLDGVAPSSDSGFHGAFGVDIGAIGFGGFAEVRVANVETEGSGTYRFVTATLGIRL
jgi:hypothetical protein